MAPGSLTRLLHPVRDAAGRQASSGTSDVALLERFVGRRDEAAFELLVWRHDRMVRGVCRQVLRREPDVEDAWQATFLTLACKARAISNRQALAGWLYKVAYRIAVRVRADAAKRDQGLTAAENVARHRGLGIARCRPRQQRVPRDCGGRGRPPRGEVSHAGRPLLPRREDERGGGSAARLPGQHDCHSARPGPRTAALAADAPGTRRDRWGPGCGPRPAGGATASPPDLLQATVNAAIPFAGDKFAAGLVSTRVTILTHEALRTMLMNRMKLFAAVLLTICLVGGGSGLLAFRAMADEPMTPAPEHVAAPSPDEAEQKKEKEQEKPRKEVKKDGRHKAEDVVTKSFKTGNSPSVTVEVFNGPVTIIADAAGAVDAKLTKQSQATTEELAKEGLKNIEIEMVQDKDNIRITARRTQDKDRTSQENVSAEVRVPAGATLNLKSSNGTVQATGGTGGINVETSNGQIQIKDSKGSLKLNTRNGGIVVAGSTGRAELTTSNGPIDLQAEKAVVTARTSNGEVRFRGTLADGAHTFATSNGRIALTLPADSQFKVDATTKLGGISTDFGPAVSSRVGRANLQATVGDNPKATITLETQNGGIEIRKKKE